MRPDTAALAAGLADVVLVAHVAVAAFVVAGLPSTVLGHAKAWPVVTGAAFRVAHLCAIVVITAEAWAGVTCPLTSLELWLRRQAGQAAYSGDFVAHWLGRLLFYDAPPAVFTTVYSLFALLVAATWWYVPLHSSPRRQ